MQAIWPPLRGCPYRMDFVGCNLSPAYFKTCHLLGSSLGRGDEVDPQRVSSGMAF